MYNEPIYEPISAAGPPGPIKETKGKIKTEEDNVDDSISRKLSAKYQSTIFISDCPKASSMTALDSEFRLLESRLTRHLKLDVWLKMKQFFFT